MLIWACQSQCNWGTEQNIFLWSPTTIHISNKHMCTHKHMHTCSQLENCLVVMCHVCVERQIGKETVRESRGCLFKCWQIPDTSVIFLSSCSLLSHIIMWFFFKDGLLKCWLDLIHNRFNSAKSNLYIQEERSSWSGLSDTTTWNVVTVTVKRKLERSISCISILLCYLHSG